MKTRLILISIITLVSSYTSLGQVPVGFNYQAVARDGDGLAMKNTTMEIILTIRSGSEAGDIVWEEIHNVTTDLTGSFTVVLGSDILSRTGGSAAEFSDIDWAAAGHFLQVTADGKDLGSAQLMSVPYAAVAQNVVNGGSSVWSGVGNDIFFNQGNVSIGSGIANSRLTIQGDPNTNIDTALFEVKNINGDPVFAVYNEGVRIFIEDTEVKGVKGGFAVGGYNASTKGFTKEFMRVTPDSVRVWVNEPKKKGVKGGFAVGGYKTSKSVTSSFMQLDPENYFIGHEAGSINSDGLFNSFFGYQAGRSNTIGSQNIFIGYKSGYTNSEGNINAFIGNHAGYSNTSGHENVFIGDSSGYFNESGYWNVFVGERTGKRNISGRSNVFVGDKAGQDNETGDVNVFIGSIAGWKNVDGRNNVFIGSAAGADNISGTENTIMGSYAGRRNVTGNNNIFLGRSAGFYNTTGSDNIYIGSGAGLNNDSTYSNIFIGNQSGFSNTAGYGNVYLGNRTGADNADGLDNTIIGHESGHFSVNGTGNTFLGAYSAHEATSGQNNLVLGYNAAHYANLGNRNTLVGEGAGKHMTGSDNIFIGSGAGLDARGSGKLIIESSGADSTAALIYGDFYSNTITFNGRVGINTNAPWNDLQVSSRGSYAKLMVGERDSIVGYAELAGAKTGAGGGSLRLGTSADFDDSDQFWQVAVYGEDFQIGTQTNFAWFSITKDGRILQRGTQLHADYVFNEDYKLESIEEHAEAMWKQNHLPGVPKAEVDESGADMVDLGARNRGVLEELEKAHIYIEQLNLALKNQEQMIIELKREVESLKNH